MYYAYFGKAVLHLAFYFVVFSMLLQFLGYFKDKSVLTRFAKYTFIGSTILVGLSYFSYVMCFLTGVYDIASVHSNSSEQMGVFTKISASWASANGSMLLFTMILMLVSMFHFFVKEELSRRYSHIVLSFLGAFFMFVILYLGYNPFATIDSRNIESGLQEMLMQEMAQGGGEYLNKAELIESYNPETDYTLAQKAKMIVEYEHSQGRSVFVDGKGLRPILRSVYNIIHPVCIYLGFIFLFPVFAMILNYMIQRAPTVIWNLNRIRTWLILSFIFLCAGNVLGGLWAYEVLGWGGFWGWDPVENASLIPCLLTLIALHSLWNVRRKSNFKNSLMISSILAFFASIWGMWVTRSGAAQSVHDYSGGTSTISYALLGLLITSILVTLIVSLINVNKNRKSHKIEKFKKTGLNDYFIFFNLTVYLITVIIFVLSYRSIFMEWFGFDPVKDNAFFITAPFFIIVFVLLTIGTVKYFRVKRFRSAIVITALTSIAFLYFQLTDSPFELFALLRSKTVVEALILRLTPVMLFMLFVFNLVVSLQLIRKLIFGKRKKGSIVGRLGSIGFHLGVLMFSFGISTSSLMSYPTVIKSDSMGNPVPEKIKLGTDEIKINTGFPVYLNPKFKIIAYEVGFALNASNYDNTYKGAVIDSQKYNIVNECEFPLAYFYNEGEKYIDHDLFLNVFAEDSKKTQQSSSESPQTQNAHLHAFFKLGWSEGKKRFDFDRNYAHFLDVLRGRYDDFDYLYYRFWVKVETDLDEPFLMPLEQKDYQEYNQSLFPEVTIKNAWIADLYIAPESLPDENSEVSVTLEIKPVMILVRIGLLVVLVSSILLFLTFLRREKQML